MTARSDLTVASIYLVIDSSTSLFKSVPIRNTLTWYICNKRGHCSLFRVLSLLEFSFIHINQR
jgi:hypothetical protein